MTMRLSTAARNFINAYGSISRMLANGRVEIYTGPQPSSADAAITGNLLTVITNNSGALTMESAAIGSVLLAGAAGSCDHITVNGVDILGASVPFDGTIAQTAIDVAAQINRNESLPKYSASATGGGLVVITALPGQGATPNGQVVAGSNTTLTATYTNMSGGVAPVNGLLYDNSVLGVISKLATQTWSGVNQSSGTAGWFRMYGSISDVGALDASFVSPRIDGAVATSGGEMNFNNTAFTSGATTSVPSWQLTIPPQ